MQKEILISIIIPTKNATPWLEECLQGIMKQTLFPETEVIVLDSGSNDGTLSLLKKFPVTVYSIPPGEFNHGLTRNYGVNVSKGKYVVMTVQDARPTDEMWLQKLLHGFTAASNVAGVCGQQVVPHDRDKNPVDWYRPQDQPQTKLFTFPSADEFHQLSPIQKVRACGWDDVTAMYDRDILLKIPFRKISYGEDAVWAKEALLGGYTLVYQPGATVYHYHQENYDYTFRRMMTVMHLRYRHFGFLYHKSKRRFIDILRMIKIIWISEPLTLLEKWRWFLYNQQQFKASQDAIEVFYKALAEGENRLDAVHEEICGIPPSPVKPIGKNEPAFG
jgi:rhamnosyltransferase